MVKLNKNLREFLTDEMAYKLLPRTEWNFAACDSKTHVQSPFHNEQYPQKKYSNGKRTLCDACFEEEHPELITLLGLLQAF